MQHRFGYRKSTLVGKRNVDQRRILRHQLCNRWSDYAWKLELEAEFESYQQGGVGNWTAQNDWGIVGWHSTRVCSASLNYIRILNIELNCFDSIEPDFRTSKLEILWILEKQKTSKRASSIFNFLGVRETCKQTRSASNVLVLDLIKNKTTDSSKQTSRQRQRFDGFGHFCNEIRRWTSTNVRTALLKLKPERSEPPFGRPRLVDVSEFNLTSASWLSNSSGRKLQEPLGTQERKTLQQNLLTQPNNLNSDSDF